MSNYEPELSKNSSLYQEYKENRTFKENNYSHNKSKTNEENFGETGNELQRNSQKSNNQLEGYYLGENKKLYNSNQQQKEIIEKSKEQYLYLNRELADKDAEINKLKELIQEKSDKLSVLSVTNGYNWEKTYQLEKEIQKRDKEIKRLNEEIEKIKNERDDALFRTKTEGTFQIELSHLKSDVKRLVEMLKSTKEFKDFATLADDNLHSITYLKQFNSSPSHKEPHHCCHNKFKEENLWVPMSAFKFAHDFRLQFKGELTETLIESLLFELNKIWQDKENKRIERVKSSYINEIAALRRQLKINPKYDEIMNKETINRLKQQVKVAYKENKENFNKRENRNPPGIETISEIMKTNINADKNKKRIFEENKILKDNLEKIKEVKFKDNLEKKKFMEGANWLARKVIGDSDCLLHNLFQKATKCEEKEILNLVEEEINNLKNKLNTAKNYADNEYSKAENSLKKLNK